MSIQFSQPKENRKVNSLLQKIARGLTRRPKLVLTIAALLMIPAILGTVATKVNYDILTYLPPDLESSQGEQLLEDPFHNAASSMLIVENMPAEYTDSLRKSIEEVPGVTNAVWLSSVVGVQVPTGMMPEELQKIFYSGDSTLIIIQYEKPGASTETMQAISQIRKLCGSKCFLAGLSAVVADTKNLVDEELPQYIGLAVLLALIAMSLTTKSWVLPFAFLLDIGVAVLYNFGTNIFLGQISYVTMAIAGILQLGVTMDYSIFLYSRYREEQNNYPDNRDAMARAIEAAMSSLSGSSLTTIAGFLALCFMRLLLGRDIGIVMAKGVMLGVLTVVLVLPSLLLVLDRPIEKYQHRVILPDCAKLNNFIVKHSKGFVALFLLLFIPSAYAQSHAPVYYKLDLAMPQDLPSIVATNKLRSDYDMATSHFILVHDSIGSQKMKEMTAELEQVDGVETVLSYSKLVNPQVPDFFVPSKLSDIFKKDGLQMIMVNSKYVAATDDVADQLSEISDIVKSYDSAAVITGEAAMTNDLITTANVDFKVTNYISIAAIFLIVLFVFKSLTVPVALVASIELAIFINQGIPYLTNVSIPFVAPTIIGCVQLGATVDYAILMTSRFREEIQAGRPRGEAIRIAATASDGSIIASSLVLFSATLGVSLISRVEIISSICSMLARGALISALVTIFILPSVLYVCEPIFAHTSLWWRTPKPPKEYRALKKAAALAESRRQKDSGDTSEPTGKE